MKLSKSIRFAETILLVKVSNDHAWLGLRVSVPALLNVAPRPH